MPGRFESLPNFRDLGGHKARGGRTIARGRVYRSAELVNISQPDCERLTKEIGLVSIIDLRSELERKRHGIGPLSKIKIQHYHVNMITDDDRAADAVRYKNITDIGDFYLSIICKNEFALLVVKTLEIIAETQNHPLVVHCAVGKDRTGLVSAFLLSALGVSDEDIIADYIKSAPYTLGMYERFNADPEKTVFANAFPHFFWDADPNSMNKLLSAVKKDYGSAEGYLKSNGADATLVKRLEKALLV
jgi:protein-tyrosine phosphatase